MKTQTKAELREQLAQALAETRWQTRRRELSDVCIDFWQAEAQLTTRRRLMRWLRRLAHATGVQKSPVGGGP